MINSLWAEALGRTIPLETPTSMGDARQYDARHHVIDLQGQLRGEAVMANNQHAGLVKAYLDEVSRDLERRRKPRSWQDFLRAAAMAPLAVGLTLGFASCGGETDSSQAKEQKCSDGADNDGDKLVDCADPDCSAAPNCGGVAYGVPFEANCTDKVDNDGDNLVDCADPDCQQTSACSGVKYGVPIETECADKIDNDGDNLIDCADSDCVNAPNCGGVDYGVPFESDCANNLDDDGDNLIDCLDPDCANAPGCSGDLYGIPYESDCANGVDDDGDGQIDCADPDCNGSPSCP